MAVIRITLILSCLGSGVLGCMTSKICSVYQNEAMSYLTSGNMTAYCRLQSKAIACFSGDIANCSESSTVLETTYTAYYNACSLTGVDVTNCSVLTAASCSEERLNALNNMNLEEYCRDTETYMTCVANNMNLCHDMVTIYDVLGVEVSAYDQMCSTMAARIQCQMLAYTNCSSLQPPPNDEKNLEDTCRIQGAFLECMNDGIQYCDPSVNQEDIIGPIQTGYNILCGSNRECHAVSTCLQAVQSTAPPSGQGQGADKPPTPNFLQECSNMGSMLTCMDRELRLCNVTSSRPYTFSDLTDMYNYTCQELLSTSDLSACEEMSACMSTPPVTFSDDPTELMALYFDPEFWCLILRNGMECAYNLTDVCSANKTVVTSILNRTNQICFGVNPPTTALATSDTSDISSSLSTTTPRQGSNDISRGSNVELSIMAFVTTPLLLQLGAV